MNTKLFALTITIAACAPGPYSYQGFMKEGLPKAAFDLQCDRSQLSATELSEGSVGVSGCGKRARYEWVYGAGWVSNASSEQEAAK